MTRKKQMKPGEKVGLTLTQAERMLLLNALHGLTEEIRDVMRATPTAQPVMLTLDNLDDLEGHVAAEANQTKDKKLRQRLDAISEKIQRHLNRHDDEPEVTESPATIGFLDRFVESLAGPRPLVEPLPTKSEEGEDQYGVKLTDKQRESLLHCTELSKGLSDKIRGAAGGAQTLGFTRDDLDELASEVDLAVPYARTPHKQRLAAVFDKLEVLRDALDLDESDEPERDLPERTGTIYQFKVTLKESDPPDLAADSKCRTSRSGSFTTFSRSSWAGRMAICTSSSSGAHTTDPKIQTIWTGTWRRRRRTRRTS